MGECAEMGENAEMGSLRLPYPYPERTERNILSFKKLLNNIMFGI